MKGVHLKHIKHDRQYDSTDAAKYGTKHVNANIWVTHNGIRLVVSSDLRMDPVLPLSRRDAYSFWDLYPCHSQLLRPDSTADACPPLS